MDISDELKDYLQEAFTIWVCLVLSCCGVVTNTSSIIVFTKQGFRDNVSISLTAIAVADDLRCIIGLFRTVYGPLKLGGHISVAKSWENISLYALGMLHNMCGSSAYVMTSYVSVERALCLCTPLKVRTIITREVTLAVLSTTCIVVPCSYVYIMLAYDIIWVFDTRFNTSIATIKTTTMYQKDPTLRKYITAITWFWGISTTSVILVSVIIIITGLRHSNEFRSKTRISKGNVSKSQLKESKLSKRDRQLVKILLLMSAVHFLNVIPRTAGSFVGEFLPGLAYLGKLTNLVSVSYSVTLSLDLFNASVNLFFFLSTSTNFRSVFLELLKSAKIQPRAVSICWKTTPCSHL